MHVDSLDLAKFAQRDVLLPHLTETQPLVCPVGLFWWEEGNCFFSAILIFLAPGIGAALEAVVAQESGGDAFEESFGGLRVRNVSINHKKTK